MPRGSRCVANDRSAEVQVDSQTPARVLAERVGLSESAGPPPRGRQFYNVKEIDNLNPALSPILSWSALLARAALASCRELSGIGV